MDVEFDLDADDGADEEGNQQNDANGVDAEGIEFLDILFEKHSHPFGTREGAFHQHEIASEVY